MNYSFITLMKDSTSPSFFLRLATVTENSFKRQRTFTFHMHNTNLKFRISLVYNIWDILSRSDRRSYQVLSYLMKRGEICEFEVAILSSFHEISSASIKHFLLHKLHKGERTTASLKAIV